MLLLAGVDNGNTVREEQERDCILSQGIVIRVSVGQQIRTI